MTKPEIQFDAEFEKLMRCKELTDVVLLAHVNPDGDAAGSVMGLAHYIQVNYPQYRVWPYLARTLDKGPVKQVAEDTVFDPFQKPGTEGRPYAVIACDTATLARLIGREYYDRAAATMVIDHHASNEGYGDVNYTKISEACSSNIYFMMNREKLKRASQELHPNAADYIYMGILHDTDHFTRADVSILEAAGSLLELGVSHSNVMRTMNNDTLDDLVRRCELLRSAVRDMDGKIAYVQISRKESLEKGITYEDIHPVSGFLRDCEDIELGFTMYEESPDVWRCSFRSDGRWINVNELLTPLGGGGHAAAAGLRKETDNPRLLLEQILARIKEERSSRKGF